VRSYSKGEDDVLSSRDVGGSEGSLSEKEFSRGLFLLGFIVPSKGDEKKPPYVPPAWLREGTSILCPGGLRIASGGKRKKRRCIVDKTDEELG